MAITRTHIGQVYANIGTRNYHDIQVTSGVAHNSYSCRRVREHKLLDRVPMFEEDGQLYISTGHREIKIRMCTECADREVPDYTWQDQALCADLRLDMFTANKQERTRNAGHCTECPVQAECLAFGLATGAQAGIWGGILFSYRTWETRERIDRLT